MRQQLNNTIITLISYIKRHSLLLFATILCLAIIIDYYDLGLFVGFGVFIKHNRPNLVEGITAILLLVTLFETLKTNKESQRQTELTLRPYMRLAWRNDSNSESRENQGIIDTCIQVINNGKGLMRKVHYKVAVDKKSVEVREHALIVADGNPTSMVYKKSLDVSKMVLGSRSRQFFEQLKYKNDEIIKNKKIEISGTYRDVEGREYYFSFVSDRNEQSWFREKYRQNLFSKHRY